MTRRSVLLDSGYLFALFDTSNARHQKAVEVADSLDADSLVAEVVLTEAAFLFRRDGGIPAALQFLDLLTSSQARLVPMTFDTLRRARAIMAQYADSRFDFVDCCLMALAEQLYITQICAFDRRDFAIFRPTHCEFLDLLP